LNRFLAFLVGTLAIIESVVAAPGDLDPNFGRGGTVAFGIPGTSTGEVGNAVALQTDGKAVVVGTADSKIAIMRLNSDGSLDANFGTAGKITSSVGYEGNAVALQTDGRIIIAGTANSGFMIARFFANGDLDTSFGTSGSTTFGAASGDHAYAVAIQTDGKILAVGRTTEPSPQNTNFRVARLNADGSLDSTFGSGGMVSTNFPGPNGTFDEAHAVTIQGDGKILVAGVTNSQSTGDTFAVARYLTNGTLDSAFGTNGLVTFTLGNRLSAAYAVGLQSTGKIMVSGEVEGNDTSGITGGLMLARLNSDGTLDSSFGNFPSYPGIEEVEFTNSIRNNGRAMFIYPDDTILMAGSLQLSGGGLNYLAAGFQANGSFISGTRYSAQFSANYQEQGNALAALPDGSRFFIVGATNQNAASGNMHIGVVIKDTNLQVLNFGQFPVSSISGEVLSVALQSDGKIVAAGRRDQYPSLAIAVARLNRNGPLDPTFGTGGVTIVSLDGQDGPGGVAVQSDGKIVICGLRNNTSSSAYKCVFLRFTSSGVLDSTFGSGGVATFDTTTPASNFQVLYRLAIQSDGKIVGCGTSNNSILAIRVLPDGTPDPAFGTNGIVKLTVGSSAFAFRIAIQSDGKIVLAGKTQSPTSMVGVRLNTDGSLDSSFGSGGIITPAGYAANGLAIQTDGKIVLAGVNTNANTLIAYRCLTNGNLDPAFGNNGTSTLNGPNLNVSDAAIQSDGRIVIGGYYCADCVPQQGGHGKFALFRLLPNGAIDSGFGNGGIAQASFPDHTAGQSFYTDSISGIAIQQDGQIVAAGTVQASLSLFGFARYTVATPPTVTTATADAINSTGATLHGNAIPDFADTTVYFQYGFDTNYGTNTTSQDIGSGSSSVSFSSVLSGLNYSTTYHYRAVATNSQGTALGADAMFATTGYDFGAFQQQYFSSAQLADPTISGLAADPNHDGITNLMAYAFELSPFTSAVVQLPVAHITNGYLTITYTQLHNPLDVTYAVEVSGDLVNWNSGAAYTTQLSVTSIDQLFDSVTVRDNVPASPGPRFIRVRITH
jgi:uncharacterized delta-60 repeat protein